MITKLTKKQELEMQETLANWLDIGRRTTPLNKVKVKEILDSFYSKIGETAPKIFYFDSPMTCMLAYSVLRDPEFEKAIPEFKKESNLESNLRSNLWSNLESNLWSNLWSNLRSNLESNLWSNLRSNLRSNLESNLRSNLRSNLESNLWSNLWSNYFGGNQWSAWKVFYDFGNKIGVPFSKEDRAMLDLWLEESKEMHWWFPYKGIVLVSEHPIVCKVNEKGQLHNDGAMAIEYKDGWGIYSLNGVVIPEKYILTKAQDINPLDVFKESNVDVRRELIKKIGIEKMLEHLPNKVLDKHGDYELISIDLTKTIKNCKYLKMLNPSIGVWHLEGVARECNTVQHAINWRAGNIEEEWAPMQLT